MNHKKFLAGLNAIINPINVVFICIGTMLVVVSVFTRYFLGISYEWVEELCRYLVLYVAFLSSARMIYYKEHVSLDFVVNQILPEKAKKVHVMITMVLSTLLSGFLFYVGYKIFLISKGQKTISLIFPQRFPAAIIPLTMLVALLYGILGIISSIKGGDN